MNETQEERYERIRKFCDNTELVDSLENKMNSEVNEIIGNDWTDPAFANTECESSEVDDYYTPEEISNIEYEKFHKQSGDAC